MTRDLDYDCGLENDASANEFGNSWSVSLDPSGEYQGVVPRRFRGVHALLKKRRNSTFW